MRWPYRAAPVGLTSRAEKGYNQPQLTPSEERKDIMEDLQSLLEKINRDGVEKADAEAKRIVDAAKARADAIVKEAREAAASEQPARAAISLSNTRLQSVFMAVSPGLISLLR